MTWRVGVTHRLEVVLRRQPIRIDLSGSIVAVVGRDQDRPADTVRVRDHQLVAREPAEAEADDVGSLDPQVVEQGDDVGREVGERRGTIDVGGVTVALELDRDHPVALGEHRQRDGEVQADGHQTAVEEHQRRSVAVLLVVQVQPVDIGVRHAPTDVTDVANSSRRRRVREDRAMAHEVRRRLGRVFDEVAGARPPRVSTYPGELFEDLVAITGMDERSRVLEVGCGTGQATRSLTALGCPVTAIEPGPGLAPRHSRFAATWVAQQPLARRTGGLGQPGAGDPEP